jgi:cardiolipin synthase
MDAATAEVRLETYIFDFTGGGLAVAQALERAAQRGVQTLVLVDGVGSQALSKAWQQRFDQAGVQWRVFSPLGRLGMLVPSRWRRLHRKLCCVDTAWAFCGGINILDDFHDPNHGTLDHPRFDFSVQIQGPLVAQVHAAMDQLWQRTTPLQGLRGTVNAMLQASRKAFDAGTRAVVNAPGLDPKPQVKASLVLRDNLRHRASIEKAYRKAISQAREEVVIANAYFVPGRKLRMALVRAAQRGVKVRLLLQGRYEYFMQYYAARPVYGALLATGVEIYEYSASFLHAKVAVIDGVWATVGSSNLDPLSLLLAREANVAIQGQAFAQELHARLVQAMEHEGARMNPAEYAARPWRQRCFEWVAYALMRVALWLQGKKYL